jgi:hypothetical protein
MATKSKTKQQSASTTTPDEFKIESVELKSYKEAGGEETTRFEAKLHLNGSKKAACVVSNGGTGGCHSYYWVDGYKMEKKFTEYVQKLVKDGVFNDYYESVKTYYSKNQMEPRPIEEYVGVDEYIELLIWESKVKKACKKKTCFTLKSDEWGDYREVREAYSEELKQWLTKECGDDLKEILNERFIEQPTEVS